MEYQQLISATFGSNAKTTVEQDILLGEFSYQEQTFALCGIVNQASLDNAMSIKLADFILKTIENHPKRPICIVIDTAGQKVSHNAELLGLNSYYGHLIAAFNLARAEGHKIFALVYGKALGGAFIASALNADYIFALKEAQIAVMWLDAMSRVTKVPVEKLEELSKTSAIFAPGAENYVRLGAVEEVITTEEFMPRVNALLPATTDIHHWRTQGASRGGRTLAAKVIADILAAK